MRATVVDVSPQANRPPPLIRIRTILLLLVAGLLVQQTYPRAKAAWKLHAAATALADYALCMVGPTGPTLIRDDPDGFWRLARRRLVGSDPFARPFDKCSEHAEKVTGSKEVAQAHSVEALNFAEYHGGTKAGPGQEVMASLAVSAEPLAALAEASWPFLRGGYKRLVKSSPKADEAVHPVALPVPVVGQGLPAWRSHYRAVHQTQNGFLVAVGHSANLTVYESQDEGVTWKGVSPNLPGVADFSERCPIDQDGRSFTFAVGDGGKSSYVSSLGPDGAPYATLLTEGGARIAAAACDAEGLVAALIEEGSPRVTLKLCPFRRQCSTLEGPPSASGGLKFPLDVARIAGTTVLAETHGGIVRVASTRDDGRSWTPYTVAFDAAEHEEESMGLPAPGRLLALEDRLVLYGGGQSEREAYLVLVSLDQGASWRSPR